MCIVGNPSNFPNFNDNEHEYVYQSLKHSYTNYFDYCDDIMNLGLANVSFMSLFNNLDQSATYGKDMFLGKIIDEYATLTIDSTTAANHEDTFGTGTNDLGE